MIDPARDLSLDPKIYDCDQFSAWISSVAETEGVFMKAVMYDNFSETPKLATLPDPVPENGGVVVKVKATGL
jgi:alcohol dehydrogenase